MHVCSICAQRPQEEEPQFPPFSFIARTSCYNLFLLSFLFFFLFTFILGVGSELRPLCSYHWTSLLPLYFFFLFYFYLCLFYAKWSLCHKILFPQFLLGYLFFLFSFLFWFGKLFLFHENHFNVEGNSDELTQPWALGGHRCALVLHSCGRHRHTLGTPFTCCSGTRSLSFSTCSKVQHGFRDANTVSSPTVCLG